MDKIYVCEWSNEDLELDIVEGFSILSFYDYTYHYNLEQSKSLANMKKRGYIIAKSLDPEDLQVEKIPEKVQCVSIWAYENCNLYAKYDWNDDNWYYSPKVDSWEIDWKDMLYLPG